MLVRRVRVAGGSRKVLRGRCDKTLSSKITHETPLPVRNRWCPPDAGAQRTSFLSQTPLPGTTGLGSSRLTEGEQLWPSIGCRAVGHGSRGREPSAIGKRRADARSKHPFLPTRRVKPEAAVRQQRLRVATQRLRKPVHRQGKVIAENWQPFKTRPNASQRRCPPLAGCVAFAPRVCAGKA